MRFVVFLLLENRSDGWNLSAVQLLLEIVYSLLEIQTRGLRVFPWHTNALPVPIFDVFIRDVEINFDS